MLERPQTTGVTLLVHGTASRWLTLVLQPFAISAGEGYDTGTKHNFATLAASARGMV